MSRQWVSQTTARVRQHKLLLGISLLPVLVLGFFVAEHVRGSVSLARYLRALSAQGEKVSAREFLDPPPPPSENGAPAVLAASNDLKPGAILPKSYPPRMRLTPAGHAVVCFREEQWVEGKVTNNWEELAADVAANQGVLQTIRVAMARPVLSCDFDPSLGPRARFPHLSVPKKLTEWFCSSIQVGLHEQKPRETVPDLVTEINLPRMLARDGIVISELVRVAIAAIARSDTWEALQADGWADADLLAMQQAWNGQEFAKGMARALEGERIFGRSSYDLMRASNQETAAMFYAMEAFVELAERPSWERKLRDLPGGEELADFLKKQLYCRVWRFAWLDQDELHYLQCLQGMVELSREASREKSLQKLEPKVNDLLLKFQNQGLYNRLRYRSEMFVSSLSRILTRAMRAETERSLVISAIAIKRYALRHGACPPSLRALVPEFLASVPADYMDGQPLRFRLQPDGGFLLYSVGEDGKDDGGDASLRPGKTNLRGIWERKDVVWPLPAGQDELQAYRLDSAKE